MPQFISLSSTSRIFASALLWPSVGQDTPSVCPTPPLHSEAAPKTFLYVSACVAALYKQQAQRPKPQTRTSTTTVSSVLDLPLGQAWMVGRMWLHVTEYQLWQGPRQYTIGLHSVTVP